MATPNIKEGKSFFELDGASFIKSIPEDIDSLHSKIIPTNFQKIFQEKFPRRILLKGPSGRLFVVCVYKDKDGTFTMEEGWKDFILGNEIKTNELLLFRHHENMTIKVQVFKPCGIEKIPQIQTYKEPTAAASPFAVDSDGVKKQG